MRSFETEYMNEPNMDPKYRGGSLRSSGGASSGWDSLSSIPFSGFGSNSAVIDMEKMRRKTSLLNKINYAILQIIYEQKKVEDVISAINYTIGNTPSGSETGMIDDCNVAKTNIDKTLSYLYSCREIANKLDTEKKI